MDEVGQERGELVEGRVGGGQQAKGAAAVLGLRHQLRESNLQEILVSLIKDLF